MPGSGALLIFIMTVAAANLCLGFAVAMYLGVGPRSWPPKFIEMWHAPPATSEDALAPPAPEVQSAAPAPTPPADVSSPPSETVEDTTSSLVQSLEHFGRGFDRLEGELAEWDHRRRDESLDADAFANMAIELAGLASGYSGEFSQSLAALAMLLPQGSAAQAAQTQVDKLSQQLQAVAVELNQFAVEGPKQASAALEQTVSQMLSTLFTTRNALEEPLATLLGNQVHEASVSGMLKENQDLTLLGRLLFEHIWLAGEGYRLGDEVGSVALIDVDNLEPLQTEQGSLAVRRALAAVGKTTRDSLNEGVCVARLSGKQFVVSLPDQSPSAVAESMEGVRQLIEQTAFQLGEQELRLTMSAAVVAVRADDTPSSAIERLRTTVAAAKANGRNRTYLLEGDSPVPVVPPSLAVEPHAVPL